MQNKSPEGRLSVHFGKNVIDVGSHFGIDFSTLFENAETLEIDDSSTLFNDLTTPTPIMFASIVH